jgi:hypothetical protein
MALLPIPSLTTGDGMPARGSSDIARGTQGHGVRYHHAQRAGPARLRREARGCVGEASHELVERRLKLRVSASGRRRAGRPRINVNAHGTIRSHLSTRASCHGCDVSNTGAAPRRR